MRRSDAVIAFTEQPGSTYYSGGRHVEVGLALAFGLPVFAIGPSENVFHHHPSVVLCVDLDDVSTQDNGLSRNDPRQPELEHGHLGELADRRARYQA